MFVVGSAVDDSFHRWVGHCSKLYRSHVGRPIRLSLCSIGSESGMIPRLNICEKVTPVGTMNGVIVTNN
jgi:hypothetical protein